MALTHGLIELVYSRRENDLHIGIGELRAVGEVGCRDKAWDVGDIKYRAICVFLAFYSNSCR